MAKAHWLALSSVPGIGGVTARRLLQRFGSVEAIFDAPAEELASVPRVTAEMAASLRTLSLPALEEELAGLSVEGLDVLAWDDPAYPSNLRLAADAPALLFVRGAVSAGDTEAVAIVGTREPSDVNAALAERLGCELAAEGLTVVSGLALGIDTAAHRGALTAPNGRTLAVPGSGLRCLHPRANLALAAEIAGRGALLSELPPDTPPRGPALMARDRILSGLSRAVIVVQAGEHSGSLDTAARALRQGRLLLALPGSPGTDALLAAGAEVLDPARLDAPALAARIRAHALTGPGSQLRLWA